MKTIFHILFFCCLSQIIAAKTVTVHGQIENFDSIEMVEIIVLLIDKKDENNATQIKLDSVGQFELILSKRNYYALKVYSKKYYEVTKTLRYLAGKEKLITIKLQKRENPLAFINIPIFSFSQEIRKPDSSTVDIKGIIIDENGEPMMFASVALKKNGALITGTQTDLDGKYSFSDLEYGLYDIEVSYVGYPSMKVKNIMITNDKITLVRIPMKPGFETGNCCGGWHYSVPLIEQDNTTQGAVFTAKEIGRSPHKQ